MIGIDFWSLQEFKEEIVDHFIMNEREVVFQPNDKVRARAKCKEKCGYGIFAARWGGAADGGISEDGRVSDLYPLALRGPLKVTEGSSRFQQFFFT